jgi:hypothetical protein
MTKAELMTEVEKHEIEAESTRAKRDELSAEVKAHEAEIDRLWTELHALGVTRTRPRKGDAPAPARKRGTKAGTENA